MSLICAIQTFPGGSAALVRHWSYFQRQQADKYLAITTEDNGCFVPIGMDEAVIGVNRYIHGDHLPRRLVDTIETCLSFGYDLIAIAEYDHVTFNRIPFEQMTLGVAAHLAGGQTWGSKAKAFYHNIWAFKRKKAEQFVTEGRKIIDDGIAYNSPESSPDCFFGWTCERAGLPVQTDLWREYSRNDLRDKEHLKEARQAYRSGVDSIHGIKQEHELAYIIG